MKSKSIIIAMFIINIILIGIIYNNINKNLNVINKQVIKEMSESTQVTDLNNQINALNANHTEYMNYVQNCKAQIATALTNQNVTTSADAKLETMAENIEKILEARTSDATATADSILEGKTAYVNGELITGTAKETMANILGNLKMLVTNGQGEKNASITVPNGITSGYVISCANAFYLPTLSIEGEGIISQTLVGSWQAQQGDAKANHIVKIFYCEFNPGKTITATMSAGGNNYATSIGILSGGDNNLQLYSSNKGDYNASVNVTKGIKSGYIITCANAFYLPKSYIEGEGILSQSLIGTLQAQQGDAKANHIVKIYHCIFNEEKDITAYMNAGGNNYATSIAFIAELI